MARGPDGKGGGAGFSLADQLFNPTSLGDLAREYAVLPDFDPDRFLNDAVAGMAGRGLLDRLEWIATCVETQLPKSFPRMKDALEAAMPPPLDPGLRDNDFGRFIHAVPGILAVRHGLEDHRDAALDLIHGATKRFSMEFYIRPFLNRWPQETLARLEAWCEDDNYHVRRLVSEGTRPRLPWARKIDLAPEGPLRLLDRLHADPTRYVTRSVANHLNDLSRIMPDVVVARLKRWRQEDRQLRRELDWMTRHALRTAIKRGEPAALEVLGYRAADIDAELVLERKALRLGDSLRFVVRLLAREDLPVVVDYRIRFARPGGSAEKVFKLKVARLRANVVEVLSKTHPLRADASTFRLYPGRHDVIVQVNGQDVARAGFDIQDRSAG